MAFDSQAGNLVAGDSYSGRSGTDIFVHDGVTGATIKIGRGEQPDISGGGRYVLSWGPNPTDPTSQWEGLVTDLATNNQVRATVASDGSAPNNTTCYGGCAISGNAKWVAFASLASNLVANDLNANSDIFMHDNGDVFDTAIGIENLAPSQTWGSGDGTHAVNPSTYQSDPVNTATGAYLATATDLKIPGVGVPLELERTYTSADTDGSPLGVGWTHNLGADLDVQQNGDVVFKTEDGQRVIYLIQPDGSFDGPPGGRSTLTATGTGYEVKRRDLVRYSFDDAGALQTIVDRNGQGLTFSYADGHLNTVTDAGGQTATFSYSDPSGLLARVDLSDGRHTSYSYTDGLLISATDAAGQTTQYGYDDLGRLTTLTDAAGHVVVTNVYGESGRVTKQTDARGHVSTFDWDPATQTSIMTDARGNRWKDVYSNNVLMRQVDPSGATTVYQYDGDLNVTKVIDARGNTTSYEYDDRANLLKKTAPSGLWYEDVYRYDTMNNVVSHVDARGIETAYEYDALGNLVKEKRGGSVTSYARDARGLAATMTDPRGNTTAFDYDSFGNVTKVTTPLGKVTKYTYDARGLPASSIDPHGMEPNANEETFKTAYTYDDAGRLLSETDPLGNTTTMSYDAVGNLKTKTDAKGQTTRYTYDAANHVTAVTAPLGATTTYEHDAVGNVVRKIDPLNRTTSYAYDSSNRIRRIETPGGRVWTYGYDANGNRAQVVDPSGNSTPVEGDGTTRYNYDEINRLTKIVYSDATPAVTMAYDRVGNRISLMDGSGTETYEYDALNRVTKITRGTNVFSYAYDASSNVTKRTYPDGTSVDYTFDTDNRLATAAVGGTVTSYAYDAGARVTSVTLPGTNGHIESRTYDAAGRLTELKNAKGTAVLSRFAYTLDPVGNPTSVASHQGTTTFKFDDRHRMTEVCYAASCDSATSPFVRWTYDAAGNRLTESRPGGTTTYTYDADDLLKTRTAPTTTTNYSYDLNGNQTTAGARTSTYDLANRMTSTTLGSSTVTYAYDGDGKRITATSGRDVTKYLWDPNYSVPQLALERTGRDAMLRRYTYGNQLLSMTSGSSTFYYHLDGLGSVSNVTSSTGAPQWAYAYEPFGAPRGETKVTTSAPVNPMRFTSALYDADTASYHLRARQYDPIDGRFMQRDPVVQCGMDPYTSPYVYVGNRPTVNVDPRGLAEWDVQDAGGAYKRCVELFGPHSAPIILGGIGFLVGGVVGFFTGGPPGAAVGAYGLAATASSAGVVIGAWAPAWCLLPAAVAGFASSGPQK